MDFACFSKNSAGGKWIICANRDEFSGCGENSASCNFSDFPIPTVIYPGSGWTPRGQPVKKEKKFLEFGEPLGMNRCL